MSSQPLQPINRRGLMLVLSSPSGAGKSSISRQLLEADDNLHLSVSATSRKRRPGEVEGVDYSFVSNEDFQLICFDIVSEPSTPNAFIYPDEKRNMFGTDTFKVKVQEAKENQIDNLFNKILRD